MSETSGPNLLQQYGVLEREQQRLRKQLPTNGTLARVIRSHKVGYDVITADGKLFVIYGERKSRDPLTMPATGDVIAIETRSVHEHPRILRVLDRTSALIRKDPADKAKPQILAANCGVVAVVQGIDRPVSARKLERAMAVAHGSRAHVVVVATKFDLDQHALPEGQTAEQIVQHIKDAALFHEVIATSASSGMGLSTLVELAAKYQTIVLLGESGAGKTSLVNALLGTEDAQVGAVRSGDNKGRHTTRHRQIHPLPGGGCILDTPGIRAIGVWPGAMNVDRVFPEISEATQHCQFANCSHRTEPGCNVLASLQKGLISQDRFDACMALLDEESEIETALEQAHWR